MGRVWTLIELWAYAAFAHGPFVPMITDELSMRAKPTMP